MEKVVVAELCGLKCLINCHPNILLLSRKTVLGPKYKDMYSSKCFFPHVLLSVVTELNDITKLEMPKKTDFFFFLIKTMFQK